MLFVNDVIQEFINHFDYLDKNGKRNGFIFFNNKQLTENKELHAKDLIKDLNKLIISDSEEKTENEIVSETDQAKHFKNLILETFKKVTQSRTEFATVHHHEFYEPAPANDPAIASREGVNRYSSRWNEYQFESFDYKDPYPAGKFEEKLSTGIEAALSLINKETEALSSEIQDLKLELLKLDDKIKNAPTPVRITFNDRTHGL